MLMSKNVNNDVSKDSPIGATGAKKKTKKLVLILKIHCMLSTNQKRDSDFSVQ